MSILKDISLSAVVAGFIAVVVGFASSAVIIFHAAQSAGLSASLTASWLASASLGCGLLSALLSYQLKMPIITAWSTPGAALLVTALPLYSFGEAIAAYLISAILVIFFGVTGLFQKVLQKIPMSIIAAMLAGILLQFCLQAFAQIQLDGLMVGLMCLCYFISKILLPRYAIICTLAVGVILVLLSQQLPWQTLEWSLTPPILSRPEWSLSAIFGISLPLFVVAMTSQNASGLAVMKTSGYHAPESKLISYTGLMSALTAPFGSHGVTLAAITAAICTSSDCHADRNKRYIAGISCGVFYLLFALYAQSMVQLFALVPNSLIVAIAGLALFTACSSALKAALAEEQYLDAAMLTFMITASNLSLWGVGSAFWGLIAGVLLWLAMHYPAAQRA
jgi:benzoate membrane transport protein